MVEVSISQTRMQRQEKRKLKISFNLNKKIKIREEAFGEDNIGNKTDIGKRKHLIHPPDKLIDEVFTVSSITTFNVVIPLLLQSTERCLELEWPQEVVSLLEMRSNC